MVQCFGVLMCPIITLTVMAYFGSYMLWGGRGIFALEDAQAKLGVLQQQLSSLQSQREQFEHRVGLMEHEDADLIEELARVKLMDGAPGQVAISRSMTSDLRLSQAAKYGAF